MRNVSTLKPTTVLKSPIHHRDCNGGYEKGGGKCGRAVERHNGLVRDQIVPHARDSHFEVVLGCRKFLASLRVQACLDFSDCCEMRVHVV